MRFGISTGFLLLVACAFFACLGAPFVLRQNCRRGHLEREATCEMQKSLNRFWIFGWYYHFAKGRVNHVLCETTKKLTAAGITQGFGSVNAIYKEVSCAEHVPNFSGFCILGKNGSDAAFLAMDEKCTQGVFFNGHNRSIVKGEIVPLQ